MQCCITIDLSGGKHLFTRCIQRSDRWLELPVSILIPKTHFIQCIPVADIMRNKSPFHLHDLEITLTGHGSYHGILSIIKTYLQVAPQEIIFGQLLFQVHDPDIFGAGYFLSVVIAHGRGKVQNWGKRGQRTEGR